MAQLVDIQRVEIGPENLTARVHLVEGGPLMTGDDPEGTARVARLLPHMAAHLCLGDAGETFGDSLADTEIAHLLEHVTVELLAQTNLAGDVSAGRTFVDDAQNRTFDIELACPDDVLVAAALSSGAWILEWAYAGGGDPEPDVEAIVSGLIGLVESLGDEGEDLVIDYGPAAYGEAETEDEAEPEPGEDEPQDEAELQEVEGVDEAAEAAESEPEPEPEPPLWTPAPQVSTRAMSVQASEADAPEVEAEIDEIMATFDVDSVPATSAAGRPTFDASDLPELVVPEPPVEPAPEVPQEPEPTFEPEPEDDEPGEEQVPGPRRVR